MMHHSLDHFCPLQLPIRKRKWVVSPMKVRWRLVRLVEREVWVAERITIYMTITSIISMDSMGGVNRHMKLFSGMLPGLLTLSSEIIGRRLQGWKKMMKTFMGTILSITARSWNSIGRQVLRRAQGLVVLMADLDLRICLIITHIQQLLVANPQLIQSMSLI